MSINSGYSLFSLTFADGVISHVITMAQGRLCPCEIVWVLTKLCLVCVFRVTSDLSSAVNFVLSFHKLCPKFNVTTCSLQLLTGVLLLGPEWGRV